MALRAPRFYPYFDDIYSLLDVPTKKELITETIRTNLVYEPTVKGICGAIQETHDYLIKHYEIPEDHSTDLVTDDDNCIAILISYRRLEHDYEFNERVSGFKKYNKDVKAHNFNLQQAKDAERRIFRGY